MLFDTKIKPSIFKKQKDKLKMTTLKDLALLENVARLLTIKYCIYYLIFKYWVCFVFYREFVTQEKSFPKSKLVKLR